MLERFCFFKDCLFFNVIKSKIAIDRVSRDAQDPLEENF